MLQIVIVNYNSADYLSECVNSLLGIPAVIHVVDNKSSQVNETSLLRQLAEHDKRIRLTTNNENIGFGPAVNRIINQLQLAEDDIVWILNPDTVASAESCKMLEAYARQHPNSVVSPVIVTGEKGQKIWCAGGTLNMHRAVATHITKLPDETVSEYDVSFLTGASLMTSLHTWRRLHGFREDLFMYWEDVDLSRRAAEMGITLTVLPQATIWHRVGASSAAQPVKSTTWFYYMFRNRIIVCAERKSQVPGILLGRGVIATLRYVYVAFRDPGPVRPRLSAIIRGTRAGFKAVGQMQT